MELVREHREQWGLNACCQALGVSKGTWHYRTRGDRTDPDAELKLKLRRVVGKHPAYGYRRIQPELEAETGERVNHKRLRRLLKRWDLALPRQVHRPQPSRVRQLLKKATGQLNLVVGWDPEPLEMLATDITELGYANGAKKAFLMAMLDPASEWVPGWAVERRADRALALGCWERVRESFARIDRSLVGVVVHQDQDSVYTSFDWLHALLLDAQVVVSFSERGAMDNPWIESLWSRFKGENESLFAEAQTIAELRAIVERQFTYYNHERRHSSLNYQAPIEFLTAEGIIPLSLSTS